MRAFAIVALTMTLLVGCGHSSSGTVFVAGTGSVAGRSQPFDLLLVNQTNQSLVTGPIDAPPFSLNPPTLVLAPGASAVIQIGYLPSSLTVGATAVGASTFVYTPQTLFLGVDYFPESTGATFIYR